MTDVDVKKLAELARIAVPEDELAELQKELPEILAFVEQVSEAGGEVKKETGEHYNIMREDEEPHETGLYSEELVSAFPKSKNGYLKVKKIIAND